MLHDGIRKLVVLPAVLLLSFQYLSGCATTSQPEESKTKASRERGLILRFFTAREPAAREPDPIDSPDPPYQEYFAALKRPIEAVWVYPSEAVRQNQSGRGVVMFVVRKNGTVARVEVTKTTGVPILDRYLRNSVLLAAPFPSLPDEVEAETLTVSVNFSYVRRISP